MILYNRLFSQGWSLATTFSNFKIAQSAGAVEYTDCTSAEGWDPPQWVS